MITYLRTLPFYKAFNSRLKCLNEFNRLINPLVNYNLMYHSLIFSENIVQHIYNLQMGLVNLLNSF